MMNTSAVRKKLLICLLAFAMCISVLAGGMLIRANAAEVSIADLVTVTGDAQAESAPRKYKMNGTQDEVGDTGLYVASQANGTGYTVNINGIFTGSVGMQIAFPGEGFWSGIYRKAVITATSITDPAETFDLILEGSWGTEASVGFEWEGTQLYRTRGAYTGSGYTSDENKLYGREDEGLLYTGAEGANYLYHKSDSSYFFPTTGNFADTNVSATNPAQSAMYIGLEMQEDGTMNAVLLTFKGDDGSRLSSPYKKVIASFAEDWTSGYQPKTEGEGATPDLPKLSSFKDGYTISISVLDDATDKPLDLLLASIATSATGDPYATQGPDGPANGTEYTLDSATLTEAPAFYTAWQNAPAVEASELIVAGEGTSVSYEKDALGFKGITLNADKTKKTWNAEIAGVFSGDADIRFTLPYVNNQVNTDTYIAFTVKDLNGNAVFKVVLVRGQWAMANSYVEYGSEIRSYTLNGNLGNDGWGSALFYRKPSGQEQYTIPAINDTSGQTEGFVKVGWEENVLSVSVLEKDMREFVIAKFDGSTKPETIPESGYILQSESPAWGLPLLDGTDGAADLTRGYTISIDSDSPYTDGVGLPATITSINGVSFVNGEHVLVDPKMDSATFNDLVTEEGTTYVRQGTQVGSVTADYTLQMYGGWNVARTENVVIGTDAADTSTAGPLSVTVPVNSLGISGQYPVTVEESYTLTFASGGNGTASGSLPFSAHYPITEEQFNAATAMPNEGYTFKGWYTGDSWTEETAFTFEDVATLSADTEVKAWFADVTPPTIAFAQDIGDVANSDIGQFNVALTDVVAQDTAEGAVTVTVTINGAPFVPSSDALSDVLDDILTTCGKTATVAYTAKDAADNFSAPITRTFTLAHALTKTDAKPETCTVAGNTAYWSCGVCDKYFSDDAGMQEISDKSSVVIPATGHSYGKPTWEWTGVESAKAVFTCAEQDDTQTFSATITDKVTKPATCTAEGERTYTATVSFNEQTYTNTKAESIAKIAHDLTAHAAKAATCTEAGNTAYWSCDVCGKYFSDDAGTKEIADKSSVVIPATGHTMEKVDAKMPTCTEAGNSAYYKCSQCGRCTSDDLGEMEIDESSMVLAAKGHTFENGVCTVCGAEDPNFVPETGLTGGEIAAIVIACVVFAGGAAAIGIILFRKSKRVKK